jgi:hypothetical protein
MECLIKIVICELMTNTDGDDKMSARIKSHDEKLPYIHSPVQLEILAWE